MDKKQYIADNRTAIGIELGSTRIKAVLINDRHETLASGEHSWENKYIDGLWTYSLDEIRLGVQDCYAKLKKDVREKYGVTLKSIGGIGVSAMMHGYMAFDKAGKLLVPFRTWRNNNAESAAHKLTKLFGYNIPARWSVAHLYQAVLDDEPHVGNIAFQTTLEGYIHWILTGRKVIGVGEASGMFPVDSLTKSYDGGMAIKFSALPEIKKQPWKLFDIFPKILVAGENAGSLTAEGAKFLDPSGDLVIGIPFCPPEGDAGTGMVATNSIKPRTGNISAGTSVFGMIVLEKPLKKVHTEVDLVTTPIGDLVAMVHCNNCSSEINAWVNIFTQYNEIMGIKTSKGELYDRLFEAALKSDADAGGVLAYNYLSGENITRVDNGCPMLMRTAESKFDLPNFMRAQLYASVATLKIGLDILNKEEATGIDSVCGHGGIFKTKGVFQGILAAAINAPVTVMDTANEGGPWGMAVLAMYMLCGNKSSLVDYLDKVVFAGAKGYTLRPRKEDIEGMNKFTETFVRNLPVVRLAAEQTEKNKNTLEALKEKVYNANIDLVKNGLVIYTWGNVSAIDRASGLVVIKPSGVDYEKMTASDMVVVSLDGNVAEGRLNPSSDTPTHLEIYKAHPEVGGIVHTHSTFATAFAQAGKSITAYGTTHADYFYGEIPCARALTPEEVQSDYEKNTGKVINEYLSEGKAKAVPACLVKNHGPFAWGKDADEAVYNATVLEEVAKMAYITETLGGKVEAAPKFLLDKHYNRKHGANSYYGQTKGDKK